MHPWVKCGINHLGQSWQPNIIISGSIPKWVQHCTLVYRHTCSHPVASGFPLLLLGFPIRIPFPSYSLAYPQLWRS